MDDGFSGALENVFFAFIFFTDKAYFQKDVFISGFSFQINSKDNLVPSSSIFDFDSLGTFRQMFSSGINL